MTSSLMNRSLETKLAIVENLVPHVGVRPVIFTSRAEIWSTNRNPVIVTSHRFPSPYIEVSQNVTRKMMQHYRKLVAARPTGYERKLLAAKHSGDEPKLVPELVLFEFQVRGRIEVHAYFAIRLRTETTQLPLYYFKNPHFAYVIMLQYPFPMDSRGKVDLAASVLCPASISAPVVRSVSLMTTAESRLGPGLCENLEEKLKLFLDEVPSSANEAVTFTSVPYLWDLIVQLKVIKHPLPRIPPNGYDHERFNIEEDILEYVAYVVKRNNYTPFCAYSRRFGDDQFADVHLLFTRRNPLDPSSGSSTISVSELSLREITDEWYEGADEILPIANRLGDELTSYLEIYIPMFAGPHRDAPEVGHCYFLFRTNKKNKAVWDKFFSVANLPQIPEHYYHGKHDVVKDVLDYMRLRHLWSKTAGSGPFQASVLRYQMGIATEVYIMPWGDADLSFAEIGPVMRSLMTMTS